MLYSLVVSDIPPFRRLRFFSRTATPSHSFDSPTLIFKVNLKKTAKMRKGYKNVTCKIRQWILKRAKAWGETGYLHCLQILNSNKNESNSTAETLQARPHVTRSWTPERMLWVGTSSLLWFSCQKTHHLILTMRKYQRNPNRNTTK